MKIVVFIIAAVFVLLAVFTAANWSVLTNPTPLSFVVFSVQGPLGVILLGIMLVLIVMVVIYALLLRTSWLMESHRLNRQLDQQRELAQQAESSRFSALQEMIEREFKEMRSSFETSSASGIARIESVEQSLAKSLEEAANSITAQLGYIDDKLNKA